MVIQILNGLNPKFYGIATALRVRETVITYVEVFETLIDYENVLKQYEAANVTPISVNNVQCGRGGNYKIEVKGKIIVAMVKATKATTMIRF